MAVTFIALPAEAKDMILEEMNMAYLKDPDLSELASHTKETFDLFKVANEGAPAFWPVGSIRPLTMDFLDHTFTFGLFDEELSVKQNIERLKKYMYNCIIISKLYAALKSGDFFSDFGTYFNGHRIEFIPVPEIKSLRIEEIVDAKAVSGYLRVMGHPEFTAVIKMAFPNPDSVIAVNLYFEIKLFNVTDNDTFSSELHIGWANGFKCYEGLGLTPTAITFYDNQLPESKDVLIPDFSKGILNSWMQSSIVTGIKNFIEKYNLV